MQLEAKNLDEASAQINLFKSYKPFKYGGVWYIAQLNVDTVIAFRTIKAIVNNLTKASVSLDNVYKVGG